MLNQEGNPVNNIGGMSEVVRGAQVVPDMPPPVESGDIQVQFDKCDSLVSQMITCINTGRKLLKQHNVYPEGRGWHLLDNDQLAWASILKNRIDISNDDVSAILRIKRTTAKRYNSGTISSEYAIITMKELNQRLKDLLGLLSGLLDDHESVFSKTPVPTIAKKDQI